MSILRDASLPRIHFDEPVSIELVGREVLRGRALNLSCGGIYICSSELLPEGTGLWLSFTLPGGAPIRTGATVLRAVEARELREPPGMALRFDDLPAQALRDIDEFLQAFLRPAADQPVRLQLGGLGGRITARPQACWGSFLSVSADLPFLRLDSPVALLDPDGSVAESGTIRWVSVQVPPGSGVPRLHIGIEMEPAEADHALDSVPAELLVEEDDPVCCSEFVSDAQTLDMKLRAERRLQAPA